MLAYRDLLKTFICLFGLISILMIPAIYFYGWGDYNGYGGNFISKERYSLGNMGYSTVECIQIPTELSTFPLSC